MRSLGWHIWQAWTIDWFFDRERAQKALLDEISNIRSGSLSEAEDPDPAPELPEPESVPTEPKSSKSVVYYVPAVLTCSLPQEQFYDHSARSLIRQQMQEVIRQEAPVYERIIKKRIVKAWNFNRTGETIQSVLNSCLPQDFPTTSIGDDNVYWDAGQDPAAYSGFRVNSPNGFKRTVDEIPPEELANAMYEILIDFNSCQQDILFRETVKLFGLSAVTQKARKYLEFGFLALKQSGRI